MLRLVELVIDVWYYLQWATHRRYRMPTKTRPKKFRIYFTLDGPRDDKPFKKK